MGGKPTKKKVVLQHPPSLSPEDLLTFVEMKGFTKSWNNLHLTDDDLLALQMFICVSPKGPPVITRTGGLRKARFSPKGWNIGKSGATRVCYAYFEEFSTVLLVTIYGKGTKDDLTQEEKRSIKLLLERFGACLKRGNKRKGDR